jgi:hypothetical protein
MLPSHLIFDRFLIIYEDWEDYRQSFENFHIDNKHYKKNGSLPNDRETGVSNMT